MVVNFVSAKKTILKGWGGGKRLAILFHFIWHPSITLILKVVASIVEYLIVFFDVLKNLKKLKKELRKSMKN